MITPPIGAPHGGWVGDKKALLDAADSAASDSEGNAIDGGKRIVIPMPTKFT